MNSLIETQRSLHEEIELLEDTLVSSLCEDYTKKSRKEQMYHEHMCAALIRDMQVKSKKLISIYEDRDGSRAAEIQAISKPNEFTEFYKRFTEVKNAYKFDRNVIEPPVSVGYKENDPLIVKALFSFTDEEGFGRFLDLLEQHVLFVDFLKKRKLVETSVPAKIVKRKNPLEESLEYLSYLSHFDDFKCIPLELKRSDDYKNYLKSLKTYLYEYYQRTHPLEVFEAIEEELNQQFEAFWAEGALPGWEVQDQKELPSKLFCVPCCKQFAKETVYQAHLFGKKHKKAQELFSREKGSHIDVGALKLNNVHLLRDKDKHIAEMEFSVQFLANKLSEQREATKMNVERKQARTASEWAEESEDSDLSEEEVEVEDDYQAALYNPKNLPLDWDGKRIPYWLYKLHGLSKYYSCEICDGAQYRGPKAFARHFQEAKHAQGMKLLGIPNTIHFQNVTNKEEAKKLWEKLKLDKQKLMFKPDQEEEYEDSLGNVVSKRIYEDLKNNNLL